jgi:hypothetical protein
MIRYAIVNSISPTFPDKAHSRTRIFRLTGRNPRYAVSIIAYAYFKSVRHAQ